jgi:hypothetical protein
MTVLSQIGMTAGNLNWSGWVLGLWSAFIVGFTGAIGSAGGGAAVGVTGLRNYFVLMGVSGLTAGVAGILVYLHNHPAPDPLQAAVNKATAELPVEEKKALLDNLTSK